MANVTIFQLTPKLVTAGTDEIEIQANANGASAKIKQALLLDRANHTGTQTLSSISDAGAAAYLPLGQVAGSVMSGDDSRVAANTAKGAFIAVSQNVDLDIIESDTITNNAKVGITGAQAAAITANTAKTGITLTQSTDIANNKTHAASAHAPAGATINSTDTALRNTDTHTDGTTNGVYTLAERSKLATVAINADVSPVTSVAGKAGVVTLVKADVGLSLVDNTPDASKPISTLQQAALDLKAALALAQTFTAGQRVAPSSITYALSIAPDLNIANDFIVGVLTGNITVAAPLNITAGHGGWIRFKQDATGGRVIAFNTIFIFDGGLPTQVTAANTISRLDYTVISATEIHASLALDVK